MKIKNVKSAISNRLFAASMTAGAMIAPISANASFSGYSGNVTGNSLVNGFASVLAKLGTYGGIMYAAGAVFALILSVRNEDTEGRNKAILNLLAAIGLISMSAIYQLVGLPG